MPSHHHERGHEKIRKVSGKAQGLFAQISADIRALNSSVLVISQKIKYIVRNEKILGRNMLVLNKKIKSIQESGMKQTGEGDLSAIEPEMEEINKKLSSNSEMILRLQTDLDNVKDTYAKADDVQEMKYVIDSINPLEFVSLNDIEELLGKKIKRDKVKKEV